MTFSLILLHAFHFAQFRISILLSVTLKSKPSPHFSVFCSLFFIFQFLSKTAAHSLCRNMSGAGAPDSSIVEQLKKLLTKYGTELLKPCDSTEELLRKIDVSFNLFSPEFSVCTFFSRCKIN